MRLTLRTLIAFRDQVLSEYQQNQLAARIQQAEFARKILSRFEDVPDTHISDELLSLDANVTANYLDSSLSAAATQQFEEVAITHDDLLSEVAECHRVLASYDERLTEAVGAGFRNRIYDVKPNAASEPDGCQPADFSGYAVVVEGDAVEGWFSLRNLYGPVTSAVINAVVLVVLSLLSVGAVHKASPLELSITEGKPDQDVTIEIPSELDLEIESTNFASSIAEPIETQAELPQLDDHFFEEANSSTIAAVPATDFSQFLAASSNGKLQGNSSGKPSVRYYGQEYSARDIVYVVDASGSMRGPRFRRACEELLYSLNHLDTSQQFAVLFFSGHRVRAFPDGRQLFKATRKNLAKAQRFIATTIPQGGTEPSKSLVNALGRNPEIVFFLSDGEIPDETVDDAKNANVDLTVINTIGFENRYGARLLRALAEQNQGQYRFVP